MAKSVLTTFAELFFSGSSDDDDHVDDSRRGSGDDDDDYANDDDDDDFGGHISTTGGESGRLDQVALEWKRNFRADSTLGEWNRVHQVLQKWYASQDEAYQIFLGPLTRPFSR